MPVPKATENTITSHLKEELEKLNIRAEPFVNISTPDGRREVDLYVKNSGVYLCEAKFTERELINALEKIQNNYLRWRRYLGINGCFSILYPEELAKPMPIEVLRDVIKETKFRLVEVFPPEDTRKSFCVIEGNLSEIARELAKQVLTPPEYVGPSIDWILRALRSSAEYITIGLRHLMGEQLEDLFGGEHVFRNILLYERGEYPLEDLRLATAYLLVTQLLFYHVLSRKRRGELPELPDRITQPENLESYFGEALKLNYRSIFSYNVASRIPPRYVSQINTIISVIKALTPEKVGGDLLGTIFHDLIPSDIRKSVAAYYTNVIAAELLATLAIDSYEEKVADFAVGSGGLLVAAYRRKRYLLELEKEFTQEDHTKFVENDLLGVDVMPFAASIAACNIALQTPEFLTDKVNIAIWDSTELTPGLKIPSVASIKFVLKGQTQLGMFTEGSGMKKGAVSLKEQEIPEEIKLGFYDVIIMNPPFTRQERVKQIPDEYKKILIDRFSDYNEYLHGQLGYYGYFILLADRFLKTEGRIALVLPAAFLRLKSTAGLRRFLLQNYKIKYIIYGDLNFSEATWRREILLIARKREPHASNNKENVTFFVKLQNFPETFEEARKMAEEIRSQSCTENVYLQLVRHEELAKDLDWFRFLVRSITDIWDYIKNESRKLTTFENLTRSLNIRVRRGIETSRGMDVHAVAILGDESRALRKKDRWVVDKVEGDNLVVRHRYLKFKTMILPLSAVVPWLRTVANNEYMDLTGEKLDFLLCKDFGDASDFLGGSSLRKLLPRWKEYVRNRMGNLVILRRFVVPAPGTVHLCYYSKDQIGAPGMAWIASVKDDDVAKILCVWFNSSIHLAQILSRRVEDVWIDVHKYILSDFMVPDIKSLSSREKKRLLNLFEKFRKKQFPSLVDQYRMEKNLKEEIDRVLLEIMGFANEEIDKILRQLYSVLKTELQKLLEIM